MGEPTERVDDTTKANESTKATETNQSPKPGEANDSGKPKDNVPPEVKAALKKANKEAETLRLKLKEYEDRDKTEAQKLADGKAEAEERASKAELKLLRLTVASEKGLTAAQAKRLVGTTREELETDADDLLENFKPAQSRERKLPDLRQGNVGESAPSQLTRADLNGMSPVDIAKARREGRLDQLMGNRSN